VIFLPEVAPVAVMVTVIVCPVSGSVPVPETSILPPTQISSVQILVLLITGEEAVIVGGVLKERVPV